MWMMWHGIAANSANDTSEQIGVCIIAITCDAKQVTVMAVL
jgi:hypothetical protein